MRTPEEENDSTAQEIREAALHVANYHLKPGKSAVVAIEEAITHVRLRTKDWNGEAELRQWLTSQLRAAQFFFCKIVEHQTEGWVRHSMLR